MIGADLQMGLSSVFPVIFEFLILKAAALGSLDKSKGQVVTGQNRPVNGALVGGDINALHWVGLRVGMVKLQDAPVVEQKGTCDQKKDNDDQGGDFLMGLHGFPTFHFLRACQQ